MRRIFDDYYVRENGQIYSRKSGTLKRLRLRHGSDGVITVNLYIDGKSTKLRVDRLVAASYVPNPQGFQEVGHIKGNGNCYTNLYWHSADHGTQSETT